VRYSTEIQPALSGRDLDFTEERRIRIDQHQSRRRVVEGDDLYGDGVNIVARLEGLAAPGGICVSRTVGDQIRDCLAYVTVGCGSSLPVAGRSGKVRLRRFPDARVVPGEGPLATEAV
jgi:class 3 adenylate cyclase